MMRVQAPSRLHFGLFALPGADRWPDLDGQPTIPARQFGGVGLMIDKPGIELTVTPASEWAADGPGADRALAFATRFREKVPIHQAFHLHLERCSPEHVGLGTGTQLGLAVAQALAMASGHGDWPTPYLASLVGRGLRSALGIHGFIQGGLLVEGGKGTNTTIAPLLFRSDFPEDWLILLVIPEGVQGTYGSQELTAFANLSEQLAQTEALTRLVLLGMLPALAERDFAAFTLALGDYNRRAGAMFRPMQGDIYAHPEITRIVKLFHERGIHGVGQSSWGPTVFAVLPSLEKAHEIQAELARMISGEIILAKAWNRVYEFPA